MIPSELQEQEETQVRFLSTIKLWSWIALLLASLVQLVLFFDVQLLTALIQVVLAWLITVQLFLKPSLSIIFISDTRILCYAILLSCLLHGTRGKTCNF